MKKLFALILALCLLCACAATAENTTTITWEEVSPLVAEIPAEFVTFDQIAVKIWIPTGMTAAAAEELPEGMIGYYSEEDGSAVSVTYVDVDGAELAEYAAYLTDEGMEEVETGTVNGLPCVTYKYDSDAGKVLCIAFATQAGYFLEVVAGPVASEADELGASAILASIQAAE